ncbi:MAG: hypothetical protein V4489_06715 [Chlamydiota bacterium]
MPPRNIEIEADKDFQESSSLLDSCVRDIKHSHIEYLRPIKPF